MTAVLDHGIFKADWCIQGDSTDALAPAFAPADAPAPQPDGPQPYMVEVVERTTDPEDPDVEHVEVITPTLALKLSGHPLSKSARPTS